MRKAFITVLSFLLVENCQNKQICQKTSLPRNESFIIVSGKADPENYNEKMEIYLVSLSGGQLSVWEPAEESSPSSNYSFNYREYLVYENGKKTRLRNKDGSLEYPSNTVPHHLPLMNEKKDKILYSDYNVIRVFDLNGNKLKEFKIRHGGVGWFKGDKIAYLSDRQKTPGQTIQLIDLHTGTEQTVYRSGQFISGFAFSQDRTKLATIELDSVWNPIQYSVRISDAVSGKIILQKNMPDYTKDIKWSKNGDLGILYRMKAEQGLYPPFSVHILGEKTDKDILMLKAYEPPGFIFSGNGYTGVQEFTWSPDGSKIAYIASEPGNCNQDGGGNVHCDLDVYTADIRTGEKQKLTDAKNKSFTSLLWQDRLQ